MNGSIQNKLIDSRDLVFQTGLCLLFVLLLVLVLYLIKPLHLNHLPNFA